MTDPYSPLVQDLVPLNEVKYAARDYPSIFDSLLRRLKIEYSGIYNDYATTSQGIMLVELMAYATQGLQWFLDRTASDCFLETARTRAAVARLVKQIGYKMGAAAAASTTLLLTFPDGTTGPFTMDARWQFSGPNGNIYESYSAYTSAAALAPGATIEIPVRQGYTRLLTYTSTGVKNQSYRLTNIGDDQYLGDGTVDCWVDGSLWEEKEFLEFEKTNHYEVGYNDDPPIVQFGDGIAGNIPPIGAEVKIRFVVIAGAAGNAKANTIQTSIDTLYIGGEEVTFTVNNPDGAVGGADPETADHARRLAPFSFAARGAAITRQDYEALSNSYTDPTYGSVAKAYAFNPRAAYEDIVFNDLIEDVEGFLSIYVAAMVALEAAINADATSLSTPITQLLSDLTDMETGRTTLVSQVGSARTQATSAKSGATSSESYSGLAVSSCSSAQTQIDNGIAQVQAYGPTGTGDLTAGQVEAIEDYLNAAKGEVKVASDNAQSSVTSAGSARGALQTAIDDFLNPAYDYITNVAPVSPAFTLPSLISSMTTQVGHIENTVEGVGGLQDQIAAIVGTAETLETDILAELVLMHDRIGELFNADCLSNYVQVPILGLDADGNYSAPSVGLMVGLQAYLDGIKEVTQQVEVIDGSSILVPADISIVLDVNKDAFIEAEVVSAVVATVIGILKGRDFNRPLYLSTLYTNVKASSGGINYVNIEITGPLMVPSVIDSEGNLVPPENKMIVFGSLLIKDSSGKTLYQGTS